MINNTHLCFPTHFGRQVPPSKLGFMGYPKVSGTVASYVNEMIISVAMQIRFVCETHSIYYRHPSTTRKKLPAALKQAPESMALRL